MQAVLLVFIFGAFLNAAQPLPKNVDQFNQQFRNKIEHLVVTPDYSKLNK